MGTQPMEIKPPCSRDQLKRQACSQCGMQTYDVVVLAADGISGAAVAGTHTDDGDGRAGETDDSVNTLDDDPEE